MLQMAIRCRDCAFFSLACEGLDIDRCRYFDRSLSRQETMQGVKCNEYITREEDKDIEYYIPERKETKQRFEGEIKGYYVYMILALFLGIGFFYVVTSFA